MKKLKLVLSLSLIFASYGAIAGRSGYILNGKMIITHIDGEPVPEKAEVDQKPKRGPASLPKIQGSLYFDEDDLARCYWLLNKTDLFCVKK